MTAVNRRERPARNRILPPVVVLLLGLLTTAVCLLLLFVPLPAAELSPGMLAQFGLLQLLDSRGPFVIEDWLRHRFVLLIAVLCILVLAVLPWRAARKARSHGRSGAIGGADGPGSRPDGGARGEHTAGRSSFRFSDDGRILDEQHPGAATIDRSVPELREMARSEGIPWHTDFETEGGARALLEILRAVSTGPVGVRRAPTTLYSSDRLENPGSTGSTGSTESSDEDEEGTR